VLIAGRAKKSAPITPYQVNFLMIAVKKLTMNSVHERRSKRTQFPCETADLILVRSGIRPLRICCWIFTDHRRGDGRPKILN
jgi:hypothetical protein